MLLEKAGHISSFCNWNENIPIFTKLIDYLKNNLTENYLLRIFNNLISPSSNNLPTYDPWTFFITCNYLLDRDLAS